MKITIVRYAAILKSMIIAAAVLGGLATPAGVSQAGGINNQGPCVSSVEYECAPPHDPGFPLD
jgi:hypothetical protein